MEQLPSSVRPQHAFYSAFYTILRCVKTIKLILNVEFQRSQMEVTFYWNILYWEVPLNSSGRANILVCCVRTWMLKLVMKCMLNRLSLHTDPPSLLSRQSESTSFLSLSLSLQPLGCCECIFVSTWCSGRRKRSDHCWHESSTRCKKKQQNQPRNRDPKNLFYCSYNSENSLKHFQRQNDRDTAEQSNRQTTRRNCVLWQPFPENSVPQDDDIK